MYGRKGFHPGWHGHVLMPVSPSAAPKHGHEHMPKPPERPAELTRNCPGRASPEGIFRAAAPRLLGRVRCASLTGPAPVSTS